MWLWLLWKSGKTKYFKADEKKPTNSWLTNVVMLSAPRTRAGSRDSRVPGGLSVLNTALLLLLSWRLFSPFIPPLSLFLIVVTLFCLKAAVSHCSLFPVQSNPVQN